MKSVKFGEARKGNTEPSPRNGEGVETRWQTSVETSDEGIVQTTNPKGAAKAEVGKQNTGLARGLQIDGGRISRLYGDPVYMTDQIVTSSSVRKNFYLHKECLAIGTQFWVRLPVTVDRNLSNSVKPEMVMPSQALEMREGVETRWQAPTVTSSGEGIVQTTNLKGRRKPKWYSQKNFKITPLAKVQLSEAVCADILYGVKVTRSNHGVVVNSAVNTDA